MSNYLKPQSPLRDKSSGDFFYPLTTEDQVIMNDGNRLSGANFLSVEKYNAAEGEIPLNNADTLGGKTEIELSVAKAVDSDKLGGYLAEDYVRHIQNKPKAGFIYPLASATVPEGFLLCDGAEYSRTEYVELFATIGTTYGEGDGSTTFNVPNLQTRVPIGANENYKLGSTGGEETHTLTKQEMPSHTHPIGGGEMYNAVGGYGYNGQMAKDPNSKQNVTYGATDSAGGSQPHNNMQPYTVVNYIIATGKDTGVSVQDIITGVHALPLGVEYGGTGATNIEDARKNIGAMKMELLWENSSPSSNFGAQSVPIDLENCNMVCIIPSYSIGTNGRLCSGTFIPLNQDESIATINVSANFNISRNVRVYRNENKIDFGTAYTATSYGANGIEDNSSAIPILIYGIKGVL